MSAPVTERGRAAARTATIPAQRGGAAEPAYGWPALPGEQKQKAGQRSARRAYARRDDRLRRIVGGRPARTAAPTGRAQFVLLIMVLLVIGLVATLWFSTAATADSYRLQDARDEALTLSQQAERLHREVAVLESPPELARRAEELGMVPIQDPARLVVAPDGRVQVVGEPRAAVGRPKPLPSGPVAPMPADAVPPADPATPADPAAPDTGQLAAGQSDAPQGTAGEPGVMAQGDETADAVVEAADGPAPAGQATSGAGAEGQPASEPGRAGTGPAGRSTPGTGVGNG